MSHKIEKTVLFCFGLITIFTCQGVIGTTKAFIVGSPTASILRNYCFIESVPSNECISKNQILMRQQSIRGLSVYNYYLRFSIFTKSKISPYNSQCATTLYSLRAENKGQQFEQQRKRIIMSLTEENDENSMCNLKNCSSEVKLNEQQVSSCVHACNVVTSTPVLMEENTIKYDKEQGNIIEEEFFEQKVVAKTTIPLTPRSKENASNDTVHVVTPPLIESLMDGNSIRQTTKIKSDTNESTQAARRSPRIKILQQEQKLVTRELSQSSASPKSNTKKRSLFRVNETQPSDGPPSKNSKKENKQSTKRNRKSLTEKQGPITTKRTESFGAVWSGSSLFQDGQNKSFVPVIPPHTLILGTHPSIASLTKGEYYGHTMNAFWWIAGDCLGFRRDAGISASGDRYKFTSALRYGDENIIPYNEQLQMFVSKGFALWDIVKSCKRIGSLDSNIENEIPNDIRTFCTIHPTIRRIVFANGSTGSPLFIKHNLDWLAIGQLQPLSNHTVSENLFRNVCNPKSSTNQKTEKNTNASKGECRTITLISAISVSPAAARYTYKEKRDFWERYVYQPGLKDLEAASKSPYFTK